MRRDISSQALVLLLAASLNTAAQAQPPGLDQIIRDYAKAHDFSGTILVEQAGRRIYSNSFGLANREFSIPAANDTKYRIASITKAFTAVLVLQLFEQGKLSLNATIATYLPGYTGEGASQVTIHSLLNHTSGIRNIDTVKSYEDAATNGMEVYQLPHTPDEIMNRYAGGKLAHETGKVFDYNNADYIILGRIIESLTGKTYDQVLEEKILEPLGMTDSGMLYQRDIVSRLANTYFRPGPEKPLVKDLPVYPENWYAAGAMYSTAADLLKFSNALYKPVLLKPETLALMLKPGLDNYGYGLWIFNKDFGGRPHRLAQRPGSIMGANGVLLRFLGEDLTIIILSNTNTGDADALSFLIGSACVAQ